MRSRRSRVLTAIAAACLAASVGIGSVGAANPNRQYDFSACWDDGSTSGFTGVVGTQTWAGIRVTAVSFGFENFAGGDFFSIPPARQGSETSGWLAPQEEGGAFVGALLAPYRVVATDSIEEPAGGWDDLPACG